MRVEPGVLVISSNRDALCCMLAFSLGLLWRQSVITHSKKLINLYIVDRDRDSEGGRSKEWGQVNTLTLSSREWRAIAKKDGDRHWDYLGPMH